MTNPTPLTRPRYMDAIRLRDLYGVTGPVPVETGVKVAKAILAVAAADGDVTEAETAWLFGSFRALGAPDDAVEALLKFDPRSADLKEILDEEVAPFARLVVHDAIRVARADGLAGREREAARRAARLVGVDAEVVLAIESLLAVDDALRAARAVQLGAGEPVDFGSPAARSTPNVFVRERFGTRGEPSRATVEKLARAVLAVASADGALSVGERGWFRSTLRAYGMLPPAIEQLLNQDPGSHDVADALDATLRPLARVVLYEAMHTARADGLAGSERERAVIMAERLGLDAGVVAGLEGIILLEDALRSARVRVLSPP
ncbi:MAG TPA: hypothetical protein VM889_11610 [Candidatus Thermoplasmatota archaeon]|nr:hypothetical protein [Candidatus Thermoplasmatota archaeon]